DPDLMPGIHALPDFSRFFAGSGASSQLATLTGPLGFGMDQFLPAGVPLPYTINFENDPQASSTVGPVQVVSKLDDSLDPFRFELGDMQFGNISIHVPAGRTSFQGDFDFTQSKGFVLRVSAGLDIPTKTVSWLVQAIDPATGEVIQDPTKGLLPP